jgi:plastocyanin
MLHLWRYVTIFLGAMALAACSSTTSADATGGGTQDVVAGDTSGTSITISNFTFSPSDLQVKAGAVISIVNQDTAPHTVTSEAKQGDFSPGGVAGVTFDSGNIASGASGSITIPASAPPGTVIPYYCVYHLGSMKGSAQITVK